MNKEFHWTVVASILTGKMWCKSFSMIHEFAEWVVGHQVWTHEFGDKALPDKLYEKVLENHRHLRLTDWEKVEGIPSLEGHFSGKENWSFPKGEETRTQHPIETLRRLRPDIEIIQVAQKEE